MQLAVDNPLVIHFDPSNPRIAQQILTENVLRIDHKHQVMIEAYRCTGKQFSDMRRYCDILALDLCRKIQSVRTNDVLYRIFAFSEPRHAQMFADRFGGIRYFASRAAAA